LINVNSSFREMSSVLKASMIASVDFFIMRENITPMWCRKHNISRNKNLVCILKN